MNKHPKKESTLVVIKPDGIQRSLIGEIIRRYERTGLKISAMKFLVPTKEQVKRHYLVIDPEWTRKVGEKAIKNYKDKGLKPPSTDPLVIGNRVLNNLEKYLCSGPVLAMVWEGANAVAIVRKITGATEPLISDVGTIRGDLVLDSYKIADTDGRATRNLVHASSSIEDAEKEIALWFSKNEIINYRHISEQILYDVNLDGILE